MNCGKCGQNPKEFWHIEGLNVPKYHYCDIPGNAEKDCYKKTRVEKLRKYKNKGNKKE